MAMVWVCGTPHTASAQWAAMDRQDGTIKANFASSLVIDAAFTEGAAEEGTTGARYFFQNDLYLQGVYKGIGGYVMLPFSASTGGGDTDLALGDLELGAVWDVPFPYLNLTLRAGVGAPTASPDAQKQSTLGIGSWTRLSDLALTIPDVVSTRFSGAIRLPAGLLSARADVGVDLLIPIGEGTNVSDFDSIFRINIGLMALWKGFGGTIEYVAAARVTGSKLEFGDDVVFPHALVISLRAETKYLDIYVAGTVPLTDGIARSTGGVTIGFTTKWGVVEGDLETVGEFE